MPLSSRRELIGFDDTWLIILGIPVLALIVPPIYFDVFELDIGFWEWWPNSVMHTGLTWLLARAAVLGIRRRLPHFEQARRRIVYELLVAALLSGLIWALDFMVQALLPSWSILCIPLDRLTVAAVMGPFLVTCFMLSLYEAVFFYHSLHRSILEKERAVQDQIRSELAGLRAQINPHFLFNSLNTLTNLTLEDPPLAVRFLQHLSRLYRYILENREDTLVPLTRELEFIEAYTFLQRERFRGNLQISLDIPPVHYSDKLVPLSLQILFENAIKHNVISGAQPLRIEVFVENDDTLVVRNNLQRKQQVMHSTRVGLDNVRSRYRYAGQRDIRVEADDQHFTVYLPLLKTDLAHAVLNY